MEKRRTVLSLALVAVGAGLLMYGLFAHAGDVWPADEQAATASVTAEPAMIREVAVGGLKRDALGQLKKTYSGQAPKACPT